MATNKTFPTAYCIKVLFLICFFTIFLSIATFTGYADNTVRITKMQPSGEVAPKSNFFFTFSADIVSKKRIGKVMSNNRIRFRPAVPGKIRWDSPRKLRFLPEVALQPSTAYTVEFKSDFLEELKKKLTGDLKFKFTTERFRVTDSNVSFAYNPDRKRGIFFQARISFNYPIQADNLQRSLGLMFIDKKAPIKFNVNLENGGRDAFITSELLTRSQSARKIELSLPQGFLCSGATIGLKERFVKSANFQEKRALTINDINAESDEGVNVINIRCSEPVDPDTVDNFITIKPKAKFKIYVTGETISLSGEKIQPGETYKVTIAKGLPSLNGNPLVNPYEDEVTFPDLEPSINFNAPGRYLSNRGNMNLGLESVNIPKIDVEIAKIFPNNLASFLSSLNDEGYCYSEDLERFGRRVKTQSLTIANETNAVTTTPINLGQYLNDKRKGVFQVTAYDPENRWRSAAKVAIVTDLGILAKLGQDDLVVWINSLDDLAPKTGVKVSLISYNNQEIASGVTDNQGMLVLSNLRQQLQDFRSYMIIAEQGDDLSFLRLEDGLVDKTDFPVDGRPPVTDGYEAFLYTDRGVFRPGETANLATIIRGAGSRIPPEFPVLLQIMAPDGSIFREYSASSQDNGICQFQVNIPDYARTGKYTAFLKAGGESIGHTAFNVEDFMPDRIKVETTLDKGRYLSGDKAAINIRGMNLFGPPAAGRRVGLSIHMEAVPFSPNNYRSYQFGDSDREFKVFEQPVGQGELNSNGQINFHYDFPNNITPPGFIRAIFQATVTEEGGRSVSNYKAVEYHPYDTYIGYKTNGNSGVKTGETYPIQLAMVAPNGNAVQNSTVQAEVYSVTWNSIYRRDSRGNYTYHSERQETRIARDTIRLASGEGSYSYKASNYGCYKIVFSGTGNCARSVCEFYVSGWGYSPWAMDHPDRIQLGLEKNIFRPGETANVQIKAPFAGRVLVTVEREKVYDTKVIDLKENTGMIAIPIKAEYKPNVYVSVHLIRTTKKLEKRAPTRAFGTIPLMIDTSSNRIDLGITAPAEIRPNRDLEVQVSAPGQSGQTFLTLAAVDEGICQLTDFETPDPMGFFYGKRSLGLETYDLYGMLLPELEGVSSPNAPSGDENLEGVRRRNLNPVSLRRVTPVSLWSGLVKLDSSGKTTVKLSIPQFNGTLRLMAVAAAGPSYGSATKKVVVRDPIVLTSTYPRFLAPGDRAVIPVTLFNGTGRNGVFEIKLEEDGPVQIDGYDQKSCTIPDKEERTVHFAVVAKNATGACHFSLQAKGNDAQVTENTDLTIRPPQTVTSKIYGGSFTAANPLNLDLKNEWLSGTGEYTLCLSPLPAIRFAGSLKYLLGYPYGCLEQTTSKLFPLLYFEDLARAAEPNLFTGNRAKQFLVEGIEKIESMQLRDGSFSFWPGTDGSYEWGSIYAAHFLVEARKSGHIVSDRAYNQMLNFLWQLAKRRSDKSWDLQKRVYALYVLSLAGKPQISSMAYIKNQRLGELSADARVMLGAAYFYSGDKRTAFGLSPTTISFSNFKREKSGNLNSSVRNAAVILALMADIDPHNPAVPRLIDHLMSGLEMNRWSTTQENAMAFMALGKILKNSESPNYTGEVYLNNQKTNSFDSHSLKRISGSSLARGKIGVKITGTGACYYYGESSGVSLQPVADASSGITVKREFFDHYGGKVDLKHLKQGDLIIAKISVKTAENDTNNVAIVDLLPAGLEIENPRLASSAKIDWLDKDTFNPTYMDIRDDRLILFADFDEAGTQTFYYALRVVTCGTFTLPQIKAECMYAPEVFSISSGGGITVEK